MMSSENEKSCIGVFSDHLGEQELILQLEAAGNAVEVGAVYTHYRDAQSLYKVIGLSIIEATQEPGVLYQKASGSDALKAIVWVRPLHSWIEKIDVNGSEVPRFQKV